ncbi:flavin containing amine oxidoreductase [Colletotrichum chrysophilum]|uniref:Flavin containing amine oxidoreductase n=1 Tax=Colletotrichum chrysophilum TaxID=1836956 RepID=A0AAD9AY17_9PEZI|nr:flavin containing amine oxidoreductase [Colletotrichum chrysophilum]
MAIDGAGTGNMVHYDTIVLGAGIAGLAFASRLLQANHTASGTNQIRVLEARDRIGGRIASVNVQNCRLDTGANWIHGTGNAQRPNPLMGILPDIRYRPMKGSVLFQAPNEGIAGDCLKKVELDRPAHMTNPITANTSASPDGSLSVPAPAAKLVLSCSQNAIDEVQALAATIPAKKAKQTGVLQALVNTKAFQDAFELVPEEYHRTLGALFQGIENMEAAPLLAQTTEPRRPESEPGVGLLEYAVDDFGGEQAFLQDGYGAVIDEIAKPLVEAGVISMETVVTRVDWTGNPIIIETLQGNFTAREVVCTVPLGVLKDSGKDAMFVPNLPADKQEAIDNLGFGTLDKIFAVYSQPWWNDEPFSSAIKNGFVRTENQGEDDLPDSFLGFTSELSGISFDRNGSVASDVYRLPVMNLHNLTGQPVLSAFVSCKTATSVEDMEDGVISGMFHRTMTQWFGIEPPRPDAVHVTRWAQDPYSRGAYSHIITGLSEAGHREALQKPMINEFGGVLRLSGEHCSRDHFAMVHGALLDGWRAADASLRHSQ